MYYEKFGENVSDLWLLAEFIHVNCTDLCESLLLFDSVSRQPLFLKKKILGLLHSQFGGHCRQKIFSGLKLVYDLNQRHTNAF